MKKKYLSPEMELIDLEDVDIITTSDGVGGNGTPVEEGNGDDTFNPGS